MESCWDSTFPIILLYPNIKCLLQGCPLSISEHVMLLPNYGHVSVLPSVQHVFFLPRCPGRGSHPFCAKPTHASGPLHMLSTLPSTVFSRKPHHVCVSFFLESVPMSHPQRALSWQPYINSTPLTLSHTPHSTFLQSTYHSLPYYKFTCLNVKSLSLSLYKNCESPLLLYPQCQGLIDICWISETGRNGPVLGLCSPVLRSASTACSEAPPPEGLTPHAT